MENALITSKAIIMSYDAQTGNWSEMGSVSGLCNIIILKSTTNQYRYVSLKDANQEVILNNFITSDLTYQESTENFHMLCPNDGNVYGLNFADANDAKKFANTVYCAVEHLNEELKPKVTTTAVSNPPKSSFALPNSDSSFANKKKTSSRPGITSTANNNISNNPSVTQPTKPVPSPQSNPTVASNFGSSNSASSAPQSSSKAAPPPPGPPPPAPPPPGPPPGPPPPPGTSSAVKRPAPNKNTGPPATDFASQLKAAASKPRNPIVNEPGLPLTNDSPASHNTSDVASSSNQNSSGGGSQDFLSEMKNKFKLRSSNAGLTKPSDNIKPIPAALATPAPIQSGVNNFPRQSVASNNETGPPPVLTRKISNASIYKFNENLSSLENSGVSLTAADLENLKKEVIEEVTRNMNRILDDMIGKISTKLKL